MRPKTLPAAVAPVAVGTALACTGTGVRWVPAALCFLVALLLQIAVNFANDALDALKGTDGPDRVGPKRAVASGAISARAMLVATLAVLALAAALGVPLALEGGSVLVIAGIAALLSAWAYTGGPLPLAYVGLGDLFVLVFFGHLAVLGTAWVVQPEPTLPSAWWLLATALGLAAVGILCVNNWRDRVGDARSGKRTLAVRLPERIFLWYCRLVYGLAALAVLLAAWCLHRPWFILAAVALAHGGLMVTQQLTRLPGPALNGLLGAAARLELLVAVFLVLGLLWLP